MPFFSVVIPTRHRPDFIKELLLILKKQTFKDFEVIVSDNYTDPELSCKKEFDSVKLANALYIQPPAPVGMVENWNFALGQVSGKYIIYLTDKMFLLPEILQLTYQVLQKEKAEIVNWVDDAYTPLDFNDHFGKGYYDKGKCGVPPGNSFVAFDPLEELSKKGRAEVSRKEQTKSEYIRGKICFGAYSIDLINRIVSKYGKLFYNVSPDYTSMILALSEAKSAIEIAHSGIVHLNTKISNGGLADISDTHALGFLKSLENFHEILDSLLIKGLYAANHNVVAHDYLYLKAKFHLPFEFKPLNWLTYVYEDLYKNQRNWSSNEVKEEQLALYHNYYSQLSESDKAYFANKIEQKQAEELRKAEEQKIEAERLAGYYRIITIERKKKFEDSKKTFKGKIREFLKFLTPAIILTKLRDKRDRKNNPPREYEKNFYAALSKYQLSNF